MLIVDDAATMRSLIAANLSADREIEVVGQAADPLQAREAIKALNPDVITLDVEMPNMNGLEFLEKLMRLRPTPVVMVSTLTVRGAEATLTALELGAVECFGKPSTAGPRRVPGDRDVAHVDGAAIVVNTAADARGHVATDHHVGERQGRVGPVVDTAAARDHGIGAERGVMQIQCAPRVIDASAGIACRKLPCSMLVVPASMASLTSRRSPV